MELRMNTETPTLAAALMGRSEGGQITVRGTAVVDNTEEASQFGHDFMQLCWAISRGVDEYSQEDE